MKIIVSALTLLAVMFASSANAAFVDSYALANWQKVGLGGSVSGNESSLTLVSNNNGNTTHNVFDYTITILAKGSLSFDWAYNTADRVDTVTTTSTGNGKNKKVTTQVTRQAGPKNDKFGYVLNNNPFVQLTNNGNSHFTQAGSLGSLLVPAIQVNVNDVFTFRVISSDSIGGAATITINNFAGPEPVPVPAAAWLFAVPVMAVLKRRKS